MALYLNRILNCWDVYQDTDKCDKICINLTDGDYLFFTPWIWLANQAITVWIALSKRGLWWYNDNQCIIIFIVYSLFFYVKANNMFYLHCPIPICLTKEAESINKSKRGRKFDPQFRCLWPLVSIVQKKECDNRTEINAIDF